MTEVIISKNFTFEASHVLPKHPGKCSRLHGHSWGLTVSVAGPIDGETGFVSDYGILKNLVDLHIVQQFDHSHLGQGVARTMGGITVQDWTPYFGPTFYPSSENLVVAIARILTPLIAEIPNVRLYEIALKETCTSEARYRPPAA